MLLSLAYILLLGLALGQIFTKLKLPALLGMLITGILLGPYTLNLLSPTILDISLELRQIALVIILMRAGLALDIRSLKQVGRPAILMCFVPATFEIAGMMLVAPLVLGISLLDAAIMGAVVAAVSPAVVVPKMLHLMETKRGTHKSIPQLIMAAASVDDVYVIVLFTAFTTLGKGGELAISDFAQVPISIVSGLAFGVVAGWLLTQLFKRIHLRDTIKLLVLMSTAFLLIEAEHRLQGLLPLSGLLAIMAMGATILQLDSVLAKRISPKFNKLWVGAEVMLFVLVGATVDWQYAIDAGMGVVLVLCLSLLWRMLGVFLSTLATSLNYKERLFCMIAYLPKATVQAAIGSIPLAMGLSCGKIVLTIAVVSILITAPLGALGIDIAKQYLLDKES